MTNMHASNSPDPSTSDLSASDAATSPWWPVALSEQVVPATPYRLIHDGRDFVLFRDRAGTLRALADQCAHRRAPLSLGSVTPDGLIECPYHGWRYSGATGACVAIPNLSADEKVPAGFRVPVFAVQEADGVIQLCVAAAAPGAAPPRPSIAADGDPGGTCGTRLLAYPFRALVDLLLDAPGLVLDIPGVTIRDDQPQGDPESSGSGVRVRFGAAWSDRPDPANDAADDPLALEVDVTDGGRWARVTLLDQAGPVLGSMRLGLSPVRRAVTRIVWRATPHPPGRPTIGLHDRIDPDRVVATYVNASELLPRRTEDPPWTTLPPTP